MKSDPKSTIEAGEAILGIEFGSTRIKAVLIDPENKPIAQGSHTWENQLVNGLWTYSVDAVWYGLQDCYADLRTNVKNLYDTEIESLAAIGVSAMMHGYMAFNKKEESSFRSVLGETPIPLRQQRLYPTCLSTTFR
jgi:sugar (pentulose or hexulose) kinase